MTEKQFKYNLVMFVKLCNGRQWTDWRSYEVHHSIAEAHKSALDFERRNGGSTNVRAKIVHCLEKDIDIYVHKDPKEYTPTPTEPNWLIRDTNRSCMVYTIKQPNWFIRVARKVLLKK